MSKLVSMALLAGTFGLSTADAAQACDCRCRVQQSCAVPSCHAPMAPAGHENHAAPQASADAYRRFSYEPAMPMQFRQASPARKWVPGWQLPKSDPRKYSGGGWQ